MVNIIAICLIACVSLNVPVEAAFEKRYMFRPSSSFGLMGQSRARDFAALRGKIPNIATTMLQMEKKSSRQRYYYRLPLTDKYLASIRNDASLLAIFIEQAEMELEKKLSQTEAGTQRRLVELNKLVADAKVGSKILRWVYKDAKKSTRLSEEDAKDMASIPNELKLAAKFIKQKEREIIKIISAEEVDDDYDRIDELTDLVTKAKHLLEAALRNEEFSQKKRASAQRDYASMLEYVEKVDAAKKQDGYSNDVHWLKEYKREEIMKYLQWVPLSDVLCISSFGFGITNEKLVHDYDLKRLADNVFNLFSWHVSPNTRNRYLAPCFAFVQSNGSGKTKLLWELSQLINSEKKDNEYGEYDCRTILCFDRIHKLKNNVRDDNSIYSHLLEVPYYTRKDDRDDVDYIMKSLDLILDSCISAKVVFLFDESQFLLCNKGWAFRCVRNWLRTQGRNQQVVAVFTGTSPCLANLHYEMPPESVRANYHKSGSGLYPVFCNLFTTGIFAPKSNRPPTQGQTDYERAIPHGRPLFAALLRNNGTFSEDQEAGVLNKMTLMKHADWERDLGACFSLLGTRLQLGQPSFSLACTVVEDGYATLTYLGDPTNEMKEPTTARICFETDPVCARLAMCMMDPDWSIRSGTAEFHGKSKVFWTSKIYDIFSTGLCTANKGSIVGELAGASYLLFCGDLLRKRIDPTYRTFSVPLAAFVECLVLQKDDNVTTSASTEKRRYTDARVSFIQVVHNYLSFPIGDLWRLGILKDMYTAGIAYYASSVGSAYDMVASIRLTKKDESYTYVPLLVSISTASDSTINNYALKLLINTLDEANTFGLGIRLVFDERHNKASKLLSADDVELILDGKSVAKLVIVPRDDQFGIVEMLLDRVSDGLMESEIVSSSYFLRAPQLRAKNYDQQQLLRPRFYKNATLEYLKGAIDKKFPENPTS
jgi:hypothetical protein